MAMLLAARAVIISTGARYKKPPIANLTQLRDKEFITARRLWNRNCAKPRMLWWWAARTLPVRLPCSSPRVREKYICWCAGPGYRKQCPAT